jgi:cytoskeletal protein CcmA (bactofilin family)
MENQRISDRMAHSEQRAVISKTTLITGEIKGQEDLCLDGRMNGNITLKGVLHIGREGSFSGRAESEHMIIEGQAEGQFHAAGKIEIRSSGRVRGKIFCRQLVVAESAILDGKVMNQSGKSIEHFHFIEKRKELLTGNKPG